MLSGEEERAEAPGSLLPYTTVVGEGRDELRGYGARDLSTSSAGNVLVPALKGGGLGIPWWIRKPRARYLFRIPQLASMLELRSPYLL